MADKPQLDDQMDVDDTAASPNPAQTSDYHPQRTEPATPASPTSPSQLNQQTMDAAPASAPAKPPPSAHTVINPSKPASSDASLSPNSTDSPEQMADVPTTSPDILSILKQLFSGLHDEFESAHLIREQIDQISIDYQQKLAAAASILEQSVQTPSANNLSDETTISLQLDLSTANSTLTQLRDEKQSLLGRLAQRDRTIAYDVEELSQLRQQASQLPSTRQRLTSAETERDVCETRLRNEELQRKEREAIAESNQRVLKDEVIRLTSQLTKARCEFDATSSAGANAVRDALEKARSAETSLLSLRTDATRMQQYIDKLQSENNTTRAAAAEMNKSCESEVVHLNKIVKLHEKRSKEAEQRAEQFEEALAQEKELSEQRIKRMQPPAGSFEPHFQVLLKNMEDALNSRWHMLEKQKQEMERARESEMRMAAKQQKLERNTKDARFEAEQARKDVLRQNSLLEAQGEEIAKLKRQLELARSSDHEQYLASTPSTEPRVLEQRPVSTRSGPPSAFWGVSEPARPSNAGMDIGPGTVIPTHYIPSPSGPLPDDFNTSMREMSDIRRRHELLLDSLRGNRISFS